jgi:tRNA threonylcarbamoyladenosine biosynthesis protein TsaE
MPSIELKSASETKAWAKQFSANLVRPSLVLLNGEMGVGKTQLVRWFVEALGGKNASSPTFAIHQAYSSPHGAIDHVDLYRARNAEDVESTGFWDLFTQENGLIFVEWPEKVGEIAPAKPWRKFVVSILSLGGEARKIDWREF